MKPLNIPFTFPTEDKNVHFYDYETGKELYGYEGVYYMIDNETKKMVKMFTWIENGERSFSKKIFKHIHQ